MTYFPLMIFIIFFIAIAIGTWGKSVRRRRSRFVIPALALAIVIGVFFLTYAIRVAAPTASPARIQAMLPPSRSPWPDEDSSTRPDPYPSSQSAVAGLTDIAASWIRKSAQAASRPAPDSIIIGGDLDDGLLQQSVGQLRKEFPNATITAAPANRPTTRPGESPSVVVTFSRAVDHDEKVAWSNEQSRSGVIAMSLRSSAETVIGEQQAQFRETPWVDDLPRFSKSQPKAWVVATSTQPFLRQDDAAREARESAAAQLLPLLRAWLPRGVSIGDAVLAARIKDRLDVAVADRFVQQFPRAYGTTWRESLLIDASAPSLAKFEINQSSGGRTEHGFHVRGNPIAGLCVSMLVIYMLAYCITKRRHAAIVRAATIALMIAGIVAAVVLLS